MRRLAQGGRRRARRAGCGERGAVGLQQGPHPAAHSDIRNLDCEAIVVLLGNMAAHGANLGVGLCIMQRDMKTGTCARVKDVVSDRISGMQRSHIASKMGMQPPLSLGCSQCNIAHDNSLVHAASSS